MSADDYRPKSPNLNFFGGAEQQQHQQYQQQQQQQQQLQHHQQQQLYQHQPHLPYQPHQPQSQPQPEPHQPHQSHQPQPQSHSSHSSFSYPHPAQQPPQLQQSHHPLHVNPPSPTQNWYQAPQAPQDDPYDHARSYSYSAQIHSPTEFGGFYSYQTLDTTTTPPYASTRFQPPPYQPQPPTPQTAVAHSPHQYQPQHPLQPHTQPATIAAVNPPIIQHHQAQQTFYPPAVASPPPPPPPPPAHSAAALGTGGYTQSSYPQPQDFIKPEEPDTKHFVKTEHPEDTKMPPRRSAAAAAAAAAATASEAPPAIEPSPVRTKFPTARIKRIMQADEEVGKVAQQTPIAVGKALELFMIQLVSKSAEVARDKNSKRVTPAMLKQVVENDDQWDFLRDIVSKVDLDKDGAGGKGKAKAESESEEDSDQPKKRRGGRRKKAT